MMHFLIIGLLLLVAVGERINFVAHRKMAEHAGISWPGAGRLFVDGCPWFEASGSAAAASSADLSVAPAATTSGFAGDTPDFMAHARKMDARVPAGKKMEALMAENDHAARKLRSTLMRGG